MKLDQPSRTAEYMASSGPRNPLAPGHKTGAQNHDLRDPLSRRIADCIVVTAAPCASLDSTMSAFSKSITRIPLPPSRRESARLLQIALATSIL